MKFGASSAIVTLPPESVASSATAAMTFDTRGYREAVVDVVMGTNTTTNGAIAVLRFLESDITDATGFAAITSLTGGTAAGNFAIPAQTATGLGGVIQFQIDLRARKRYLRLQITPGTSGAHVVGATAHLFRGEQLPVSAAQKSVSNRDATNVAVHSVVQV
jgi:hypothetical protein